MYLPNDLSTILTVTIRIYRTYCDYWRVEMSDQRTASTYQGKIWALMDIRDALCGGGGGALIV